MFEATQRVSFYKRHLITAQRLLILKLNPLISFVKLKYFKFNSAFYEILLNVGNILLT